MELHFADSLPARRGQSGSWRLPRHVGQRGGGLACRGIREERLQQDGVGVLLIGDIAVSPTIHSTEDSNATGREQYPTVD